MQYFMGPNIRLALALGIILLHIYRYTFMGRSTPDDEVCKQTPRSAAASSFG